jgi:predicted MPP superfamily phosphohydrolase
MFQLISYSLILLGLVWWRWVDRRLRTLDGAMVWRALWAMYALAMVVIPLTATRMVRFFPEGLPAAGMIWHVLVLPVTTVPAGAILLFARRRQPSPNPSPGTPGEGNRSAGEGLPSESRISIRHPGPNRPEPSPQSSPGVPGEEVRVHGLSRRNFLTAAAGAVPVLATVGLTSAAQTQLGTFRVRPIELALPNWPAELDGFTIAMVADIHNGLYTTPAMLADIVERTNTIHNGGPADLVVLGGDLINTTIADLPEALDVAKSLRGRLGTVAILGNHDVIDSEHLYVRGVERAGIPLLIDRNMTIEPKPGVRVELLGVGWNSKDQGLYESVQRVVARRNSSAYPICLSHHPHAWDEAVRQALPLVLSGHTHGGQIMFTKNFGGGPLKFRYWTGVHQRDGSTLAISNGVGNWFPLRINAPAELIKFTLRRAVPPA